VHRAIEAIGARAEQRESGAAAAQRGDVGMLEPREMLHALTRRPAMGTLSFSQVFANALRERAVIATIGGKSEKSVPLLPTSAAATLTRLRARATEVSGCSRVAFARAPSDGGGAPAAALATPQWPWPPLSLSRGAKAQHAERLEQNTRAVLALALARVTNVRLHQVEVALSTTGNVRVTETEWIVEHSWVVFFTARLIKQLGETTMLLAVNSLFWSGARGGGGTQRQWREQIGLRTHKADANELEKPLRKAAEANHSKYAQTTGGEQNLWLAHDPEQCVFVPYCRAVTTRALHPHPHPSSADAPPALTARRSQDPFHGCAARAPHEREVPPLARRHDEDVAGAGRRRRRRRGQSRPRRDDGGQPRVLGGARHVRQVRSSFLLFASIYSFVYSSLLLFTSRRVRQLLPRGTLRRDADVVLQRPSGREGIVVSLWRRKHRAAEELGTQNGPRSLGADVGTGAGVRPRHTGAA
jgi:hypothetical protein